MQQGLTQGVTELGTAILVAIKAFVNCIATA